MLEFLENSIGLYITETIEALETISAHNAAGTRPAMGDNKLSQNAW